MRNFILIFVAVAALGLGAWAGWWAQTPATLHTATRYPEPRPLAAFTLTDQNNQPFTLAQARGRWTLWFFGYTQCPDICPAKLAVIRQVYAQLERQQPKLIPKLQAVFVSVDPARDSPAHLADYTAYFDKRILGVTGTPEALALLTRQMGVVYMQTPNPAGGDYLVDHSATLLLTDPNASVYAVFGAQSDAQGITQDLLTLLN